MKVYEGVVVRDEHDRVITTAAAVWEWQTTGRLRARVGRPLAHRLHHSPDGFAWGYHGSGPAELARSILADHLGGRLPHPAIYQAFKELYVARWEGEREWAIDAGEVAVWLRSTLRVTLAARRWQDPRRASAFLYDPVERCTWCGRLLPRDPARTSRSERARCAACEEAYRRARGEEEARR